MNPNDHTNKPNQSANQAAPNSGTDEGTKPSDSSVPTPTRKPSLAEEAAEVLEQERDKEASQVIDITKAEAADSGVGEVQIVPKKKPNKKLYVGIIALFILIVGGGSFIVMKYVVPSEESVRQTDQLIGNLQNPALEPSPVVEPHAPFPPLHEEDDIDSIELDMSAFDLSELDTDIELLKTELSQ